MREWILGIWLGIQGYWDFKFKEIPLWFSLVGGGGVLLFCVIEQREFLQVVISCIPGMCALVFSWTSKEAMGYGDGIVILILGCYLSLSQLLFVILLAFGSAGVFALVLLVFFHKRGKYRIPFIPFLGIAYGIDYVIKIGESVF